MPLYQLIFSAVIYALAEKGLTAYETMLVLPESERMLHEWLSCDLQNQAHAQVWKDIRSWKPNEYRELVASFYRRMHRLFRNPVAARIFGQTGNALDTLEIMDQGHTLLVNLKPNEDRGFSGMTSILIGKLLVNDFQQTALNSRPANKARPHILFIDECPYFLSGDVPRILDGTRKYGLHLVLSHQRIEQLYEAGPNVADGVMAGAQTKLFFGSTYKTWLSIADEIFGSTYNLERPKESLKKPFLVGHKLARRKGGSIGQAVSQSHTVSQGDGEADIHGTTTSLGGAKGRGSSAYANAGAATGEIYGYPDPYFPVIPNSLIRSNVETAGSGGAETETEIEHWASGTVDSHVANRFRAVADQQGTIRTAMETWQEVLEPIIEFLHTDTYKIDELRHEAAVEGQALEKQRLILKRPMSREVLWVKTESFVRPVVEPEPVHTLTRLLKRSTGLNKPTLDVERA